MIRDMLIGYENHEKESVKIATDFLKEKEQSDEFIAKVSNLIMATVKEYIPKTHLEKIIKDADFAHIIGAEYATTCELLRIELKNTWNLDFSNVEWAKENLNFLMNKHRFYTDYALKKWQPLKEKNLVLVQKKIKKQEKKEADKHGRRTKKERKNRKTRSWYRYFVSCYFRKSYAFKRNCR